ncbi:restriction endonuclease [Streptomyces sp. NPDC005355]|uniref:nSTAND3 domain-containing NTPase n=1 Tax=Streptomyces sp. NPDC005355 TaxID=3157038 RepID=UPI0033AE5E54
MARNYGDLSPYDFEALTRDLLQEELDERLEIFPPGRDGGVDVRLFKNNSEQLIVQCKHTPGKRYPDIESQLKREAAKVAGRFDARYMLVSTATLTRANKRSICQLFDGVNLRENDIWGVDDLNNYLSLHPGVEQRNFKLWVTSTGVMQRLLHSGIHERSAGLLEHIKHRARIYVHSEAYGTAMELLKRYNACLISGEPGIGKTTLAEMLLIKRIDEGWQAYVASEDISDVENIWNQNERQIFFYDDFLGQNSLADKLNKNEDSRLVKVLSRIQETPGKQLIMTTREYILRQARQVYEPLSRSRSFSDAKFILNLSHYTPVQKAHIFYNHIYFSNLTIEARESVLEDRVYRDVVRHPNYNPRLVELVTATYNDSQSGLSFAQYTMEALEDPAHLWEIIYEDQLSDSERSLLMVLATFAQPTPIDSLQKSVQSYEESAGHMRSTPREFRQALKRLQGTFLSIDSTRDGRSGSVSLVRPANPSFNDYICQYASSHPNEIDNVVRGALYFEQLETLWRWHNGQYAFNEDLVSTFLRGPVGRISKPSIRILDPILREFARAAFRTADQPSGRWLVGIRGQIVPVRRPNPAGRRDLSMLNINNKLEKRLLSPDMLDSLYARSMDRLLKGTDDLEIDNEVSILRHLVATGKCSLDLCRLRQIAYEACVDRLETAVNCENVWELLHIEGLLDIPELDQKRDMIQKAFLERVETWDEEAANDAESASQCEDAIGELLGIAHTLGVQEELNTPALDNAFSAWSDSESDKASDYYAEYGSEEYDPPSISRPSGKSRLADILADHPDRQMDAMFDTLR